MNSFYNGDDIQLVDMFSCDTFQESYIGKYRLEKTPGLTDEQLLIKNRIIEENKSYEVELITETTCPALVSFKIDNVNYTAESGMTFSEWMNSGYNIDDIEIVDLQDCSNFVSEYVGKRRLINLPSNLTGNAGLVNNLVIQANASYQTELIDGNTCDDGE